MASKTDLRNIQNLDNPASAVGALNFNFNELAAVIDTLLSRDGSVPNSMLALLDMNNNRIINLPVPTTPTEPARHGDIQQYVDQAEAAAEFADERADFAEEQAEISVDAAEVSVESLTEFLTRYLGTHSTHPTENPFTEEPITDGALYFNTNLRTWFVYYDYRVVVNSLNVLRGADQVRVGIWEQVPRSTLRTLNDVDGEILNNQIYRWNTGQQKFLPVDLAASIVSIDNTGTAYDGSTVQAALEEMSDRASVGFYDLSFFIQGLMEPGEVLFKLVSPRNFELRTDGSSIAVAGVAPNASTTVSINRNGTNIGSIVFQPASTTGTVTISPDFPFVAGDTLEIVAPSPADTLLRNTSITLTARR